MAEAAYVPLTWTRGNTFYQPIWFGDGRESFDLTGSELVFRVIDSAGNQYFRASTEDADSGFEITDAVNGEGQFNIPWPTTRDAPTRGLTYTIERRIGPLSPTQVQESLMKGPLTMITDANDDG